MMEWWKRMNTVLDYIEENLGDEIKDSKIAELFASSKGMFQRIFSIITEMTLAEYIRKRRLTEAAAEIRDTDAKIIDVAVKYGYDSARAFSSAFKSFHGITPSEARISTNTRPQSFQKFTFALTLTVTGGSNMQYRIIENAEDMLQKIGTTLDYERVDSFVEDVASVLKCDKFGFIDKDGKVVIPLEYERTDYFSEGLAAVQKNGKWGFIDKYGAVIIPFGYDELNRFAKGMAKAKKEGKWGLINKANETLISFEYDGLDFSDKDFIVADKSGKIGVIDISGRLIVPFGLYSSIGSYPFGLPNDEGLIMVKEVDETEVWRCGFIDKSGKVVIPLEYDRAGIFLNGHAWVCKDQQFSYVDKVGNVVLIECEKDEMWEVFDDLIPHLYNITDGSVSPIKGGYIITSQDKGKYGLTDNKTHEVILPIKYDEIRIGNGYITTRKGDQWGILDMDKVKLKA